MLHGKFRSSLFCLLMIGLSALSIVGTHRRFSQTFDEPAHIASGLEWLSKGTYTYESLHPPLARIASAVGPYVEGERTSGETNMWREGNRILHNGDYTERLASARLGILPFFVLLALGVFVWGRSLGGEAAGLLGMLLACTTPTILAHAGLATTDLAVAAFVVWSCYAFDRVVREPDARNGMLLGGAFGLALASKISSILFLGVAVLVMSLLRLVELRWAYRSVRIRALLAAFAKGAGVAFVVLWSCYRLDVGPLVQPDDPKLAWALQPRAGAGASVAALLLRAASWEYWPMPEFVRGVGSVLYEVDRGRLSYLLGDVSPSGHRLFFPVAIAAKMPLLHLLLILAGIGVALLRWRSVATVRRFGPLAFAVAALLLMAPSKMTIGLRHALPVLAVLCVHGGLACAELMTILQNRAPVRLVWATLSIAFALQVGELAREYPNHLAYFNPVARASARPVLVDSDLDWGQDLPSLQVALAERGVRTFSLAYWGTADVARFPLPTHRLLRPGDRVTGWVAISETSLAMNEGFGWLRSSGAFVPVGRSMRLYFIPDAPSTGLREPGTITVSHGGGEP